MKNLLKLLTLTFLSFTFIACDSDDLTYNDSEPQRYLTMVSGSVSIEKSNGEIINKVYPGHNIIHSAELELTIENTHTGIVYKKDFNTTGTSSSGLFGQFSKRIDLTLQNPGEKIVNIKLKNAKISMKYEGKTYKKIISIDNTSVWTRFLGYANILLDLGINESVVNVYGNTIDRKVHMSEELILK